MPTCFRQKASSKISQPVWLYSYIHRIVERLIALAQRLENDVVFVHLVETCQEFTGDVLKLIFSATLREDQS